MNPNLIESKPVANRLVFFLICALPIFASVIFGAVSAGTLALLTLFFGFFLVCFFVDVWKSKKFKISKNALQLPIIGLIVIGLVQLLPLGGSVSGDLLAAEPLRTLSLDPASTKLAIVKLAIFLSFLAIALVYVDSPKRLKTVVFTVIVFAGVMSFIGILQRLASPNFIYGMREVDYATPFASYVNQHHFAAFMEMTIGLTLALLLGNAVEKDKRLLLIIAVVLMGIAIVLTGSRGGFLSLLGVLGFLVLVNVVNRKKDFADNNSKSNLKQNLILVGGSGVLVVFLLGAVIWLGQGGTERILNLNQPDFTTGRTHFWSVSLQIIRDNPIIGAGLEAFGVAFTKYDTWNGNLRVEQAHNDYLQTLADAGILGFLCIVAFVVLLFKKGLEVIRESGNLFRRGVAIGALAGCFGILVHSFFDFPLRTNANMLFFLLLVVLATKQIEYPKMYRKPALVKPE